MASAWASHESLSFAAWRKEGRLSPRTRCALSLSPHQPIVFIRASHDSCLLQAFLKTALFRLSVCSHSLNSHWPMLMLLLTVLCFMLLHVGNCFLLPFYPHSILPLPLPRFIPFLFPTYHLSFSLLILLNSVLEIYPYLSLCWCCTLQVCEMLFPYFQWLVFHIMLLPFIPLPSGHQVHLSPFISIPFSYSSYTLPNFIPYDNLLPFHFTIHYHCFLQPVALQYSPKNLLLLGSI